MHCPETTSKTSFQKNLVYAYFKVKKFWKNSPDSPCILVYTFQMKKKFHKKLRAQCILQIMKNFSYHQKTASGLE